MTPSKRRLTLTAVLLGAGLFFFLSYRASLTPATHPDHDHGIMNLDAGGRLEVTRRDGSTRNLVGAPKKVLVVHFFDVSAEGAADELRSLFAFQDGVKGSPDVEFVLIAREKSFEPVDSLLSAAGLTPPVPDSVVLDRTGDTTSKFNSKRPIETMVFGPEGHLAWQARGRMNWAVEAAARIEEARAGASIH